MSLLTVTLSGMVKEATQNRREPCLHCGKRPYAGRGQRCPHCHRTATRDNMRSYRARMQTKRYMLEYLASYQGRVFEDQEDEDYYRDCLDLAWEVLTEDAPVVLKKKAAGAVFSLLACRHH